MGPLSIFIFPLRCYAESIQKTERTFHMTNAIRSAEYRYFSFTYFMGKAYLGLAEQMGTRV